jgi:hypothetical protein
MSGVDVLSGAWSRQGPSQRNPPRLLPCYLRRSVDVFVLVNYYRALLCGVRGNDEVGKGNAVLAACGQEGLDVEGSIWCVDLLGRRVSPSAVVSECGVCAYICCLSLQTA